MKIEESENATNTKTLPKSKKLWNMKVTIIVEALQIVSMKQEKRLSELEIRRRIKIILTTALLELAIILRRVLETRGDLLTTRLQQKISV